LKTHDCRVAGQQGIGRLGILGDLACLQVKSNRDARFAKSY